MRKKVSDTKLSKVDTDRRFKRSRAVVYPLINLILAVFKQAFRDLLYGDKELRYDAFVFLISSDAQSWLNATGLFEANLKDVIKNPEQIRSAFRGGRY